MTTTPPHAPDSAGEPAPLAAPPAALDAGAAVSAEIATTTPTAPPLAPNLVRAEYALIRRKITEEDHDFATVVTGYEGSGKSTLALILAGYTDPDFGAARVAFDAEELLQLLRTSPKGASLVFDEAVKGAYSRESMTATNRAITTASMVSRAKNFHLILCIPSLWNLDAYFRDHRARVWAHVQHRGEALFHVPSRNTYAREVFWQPVIRHQYAPIRGAMWDAYLARKMAFIDRALAEEMDEPEGEENDAEAKLRTLAEEVAANDEFWTAKGSARRGLLVARYGLGYYQARKVAEIAKAIRDGA